MESNEIDWRRGWDSNPRATLTGCKLLILHIATKAENARNAKLRYTAGTRPDVHLVGQAEGGAA